MNLLIVDDEELTREGLLSSIDWASLGILNVYQADDGINGLALARKVKPQVILSDVRMPRMSGIEMAAKIREDFPDCHIIFMSGYSDKEYLKAAIRLKAISYVEKPILPREVEEAVKEAISTHAVLQQNKDSATRIIREASTKLALDISHPFTGDEESLEKRFSELHMPVKTSTSFTTVIVRFVDGFSILGSAEQNTILNVFNTLAAQHHMQHLWAVRHDEYLVCHLISSYKPAPATLTKILSKLKDSISLSCRFYISAGKTVTGLRRISESYNLAVLLLQSSFFYEYNSVIPCGKETRNPSPVSSDILPNFHEALTSENKAEAQKIVLSLYEKLVNNLSIPVNYAKDIYYKLFAELYRTASQRQIYLANSDESSDTLLDYISKSGTLTILHNLITEKIELLFYSLAASNKENSTIFLIKAFISKNFQNENLSVKDISEHVYLSASYVCTIFKNETGKTLNQYLTEYRIERAKILLLDPRYKITEISAKVGYSDGNYFGKIFRKTAGLSPSEFRENNAK